MLVYAISLEAFPIGSEYPFANRKSKSFSFLFIYKLLSLSLFACHARHGLSVEVLTLWAWFSTSTLTWVLGVELRSLGLCGK